MLATDTHSNTNDNDRDTDNGNRDTDNRDTNHSDTTTDTTAQGPGLHDSDSFSKFHQTHRYWSNKITILRTFDHPYSHQDNPPSAKDFVDDTNASGVDESRRQRDSTAGSAAAAGGSTINDTMHAVVISVFSLSRYQEAEVMLKSLFMHRISTHPLVLHLIVDPAGKEHFTKVSHHASLITFYRSYIPPTQSTL